jgi:uncharacterized protein
MEILIGAFVGFVIGLTGLGAGILMTPILILGLRMAPSASVGAALIFSTVVKFFAGGVYLWRGQVAVRTLLALLAGGIPGALGGSWLLYRAHWKAHEDTVTLALGILILLTTTLEWRRGRNTHAGQVVRTRHGVLALLTFPIGASVGFSSAGAGSLGTLALLRFTSLAPVQVVGTDLLFGLALSATGGLAHVFSGAVDTIFLAKLLAGGLAGGLAGARLADKLPGAVLRHWLVLALAALGAVLIARSGVAILPVV